MDETSALLMRSNFVVGFGDSLRDEVTSTSWTTGVLTVSSVKCIGLPNSRDVNNIGKEPK